MNELNDADPERHGAQIAAALSVLRSPERIDPASLRDACAVLLTFSKDPFERVLAEEVLRGISD